MDTVQRAYSHDGGGYFKVDNSGAVPIFSKILGIYNFKSIAGTDDVRKVDNRGEEAFAGISKPAAIYFKSRGK